MRSETVTRRAFVKTAAIHYMSSNQGFPTSVDIRNEMQAMGVEKGTKNLRLLKEDLNFVADDLVAIIQQKEQLASDGQNQLIPDSVFEMTLKFYNEIKVENQRSYEQQMDIIQKEQDQDLQDKKVLLTREKEITAENTKLQDELKILKHELTQERTSIVEVNQSLEAAHKEMDTQQKQLVGLQKENQALQLTSDGLKDIFNSQLNELKDLYEDSENKITETLQKREKELKSLNGQLANQTEQFQQLKGKYDTDKLALQKAIFHLKQLEAQQNKTQALNEQLTQMQAELKTKSELIEKLLSSIQTKPDEKKKSKRARRTKAPVKKALKKVMDETSLYYTRTKLKKALAEGQVSTIIAKGNCVQFMLKDQREGYLVNAQRTIRQFASEKKAWDLIEQLKS